MHESSERRPAHTSVEALRYRPKPERPPNIRDATFQRQAGMFLMGASVLGFLLIVLFTTLTVKREQDLFQRLQQAGVKAEAEVIDRFNVGHGIERLTYRFSASLQGATQSFVATDLVDRTRDGSRATGRVTIVYDPADPRRSRVLAELRAPVGVFARVAVFCWLGWPLPLIGLLVLRSGNRRRNAAQQLEQAGQLAQGVVVDRWVQWRNNGGNALAYQFDALLPGGGSRRVVKGEIVDRVTWYAQLQIGAHVRVRYLPDNPNLCRIEEPL